MKNRKLLKLTLVIYACLNLNEANAQCDYQPVLAVCHEGKTETTWSCCGWFGHCISVGIPPLQGTKTDWTIISGVGLAATCGGGSQYRSRGEAFTGTCSWTVSGVQCGQPYGPTPVTGPYTAYPCEDPCPNG